MAESLIPKQRNRLKYRVGGQGGRSTPPPLRLFRPQIGVSHPDFQGAGDPDYILRLLLGVVQKRTDKSIPLRQTLVLMNFRGG